MASCKCNPFSQFRSRDNESHINKSLSQFRSRDFDACSCKNKSFFRSRDFDACSCRNREFSKYVPSFRRTDDDEISQLSYFDMCSCKNKMYNKYRTSFDDSCACKLKSYPRRSEHNSYSRCRICNNDICTCRNFLRRDFDDYERRNFDDFNRSEYGNSSRYLNDTSYDGRYV